jgi:hypothetical protein
VAGGAAGVPCDGGEEERRDDAPAGGGARRERGEVEEVEEGEARDAGADEERHEHAEREVVEALQAHDLRHDQPGVPHHRPIEHLRLLPPAAAAAAQPSTRSEEVAGERERAAVVGRGICLSTPAWEWGEGFGTGKGTRCCGCTLEENMLCLLFRFLGFLTHWMVAPGPRL